MGVMLGFFVGYVMGTRAGEQGFEELKSTVQQILTSGELKELLAGGVSFLGEALSSGTKALSERSGPAVRRVA